METLEISLETNAFDDDGRIKRTGTWLTASAHIITAVAGSGVFSLAWAIAQLGWVAGPAVLFAFSFITFFTSTLLADSYRSPGPVHGTRNYTYTDVVRSHLGGGFKAKLCGIAQYANLVGANIGYTIVASISMVAVERSNCFHKHGRDSMRAISNYPYMAIFGVLQIILSQILNFHELSWLSILAAVMFFAYSSIGLGLSVAKVAGGGHARTTLTGTTVGVDVSAADKVWNSFIAIGNIALAYSYSYVLIEIQDTLESQPAENKSMKRASLVGLSTTTVFYVLCGCVGYAAFGNDAPGNFLTGFGFYEPFWLIDFANVCIAVYLIGGYQVFAQPVFGYVEKRCSDKWPESKFITAEHKLAGGYTVNVFRLVWRTAYVVATAVLPTIFPFFNMFLGLIGAASFYPLTVYFPIEIYIAQAKVPKLSATWVWLKILSWVCLTVSVAATVGYIHELIEHVQIRGCKPTHFFPCSISYLHK